MDSPRERRRRPFPPAAAQIIMVTAAAAAHWPWCQNKPHSIEARLVKDYSSDAIRFFTEIRTPAAFCSATRWRSSFFSMSHRAKDSELQRNRAVESAVLLLYHVMSLISFLLSLDVVLSSTAASITLLMGVEHPLARSTYELLYRELNFEFLVTRFSFFISMYNFFWEPLRSDP
jgi:hypothetical protein